MSIQQLIQEAGIVHAHVIDDAFDTVPGAELSPENVNVFLNSLSEEQFDNLAVIFGNPEAKEDEIIALLTTHEGTISLYNHRAQFGEAGGLVFEEFTSGLEPEKKRVGSLINALEGLGIICHTFGRDYEFNNHPEPQMLFVDLKLNERQIVIDEPINIVKVFRRHYPKAHPLVFLMSTATVALDANQEIFRDKCELLSTQFEILSKDMFTSLYDLELFLKHHVSVYSRLCKLQDNISAWGDALDTAKQKLLQVMRCLDLADYFVLHQNTVVLEQVPLGTYVTDLLLEYVAHEIEASNGVWAFAKDLDDWKVSELTRSRFNLKPIVGDIFSGNVLHAGSRIAAELERGRGPADGYFNLGDVFFNKKEDEKGSPKSALVVLSPACDLVRPSVLLERRGSILLCEGDVEELKPNSVLKDIDGLNPIVLRYPENSEKRYIISWQKKRPHIWRPEEILSFKDTTKAEWIHVGRIRPLYALQLQHIITSDLSRVGVQRPPELYVPYGLEVLVLNDDKWKVIVKNFGNDPTSAAISNNKGIHKMTFIVSDVVVRDTFSRLRKWVSTNTAKPSANLVQQIIDCKGVDSAIMYYVHQVLNDKRLLKQAHELIRDDIYPLRGRLPEGTGEEIYDSVIFALQGRESDNIYAGGKKREEGAKGVIVFRFMKI